MKVDPSEEWACPICTYLNPLDKDTCTMCFQGKRPATGTINASSPEFEHNAFEDAMAVLKYMQDLNKRGTGTYDTEMRQMECLITSCVNENIIKNAREKFGTRRRRLAGLSTSAIDPRHSLETPAERLTRAMDTHMDLHRHWRRKLLEARRRRDHAAADYADQMVGHHRRTYTTTELRRRLEAQNKTRPMAMRIQ